MHSVGLRHAVLTYRVGQESEPLAFLNTVLKCVPIKLVLSDLSMKHKDITSQSNCRNLY